jgi:hypothetical protein
MLPRPYFPVRWPAGVLQLTVAAHGHSPGGGRVLSGDGSEVQRGLARWRAAGAPRRRGPLAEAAPLGLLAVGGGDAHAHAHVPQLRGDALPGPPYVTAEARGGVSTRAVSTEDRRSFLADFAASISGLPDGTRLQLRTAP